MGNACANNQCGVPRGPTPIAGPNHRKWPVFSAASRYAAAADAKIMIDNFAFSPTPLIVARSTSVVWENRDDIAHAIYFPALNVHSKVLDTNDAFRYRFDQGGTFDYICSIHPHMRGRIVVSD